jgi:hypothetical protein
MMKRSGLVGLGVVAALALSGIAALPASANLSLACYKAQNDEFGVSGNYKNKTCTEKTAVLKGEYVLAEPTDFITEDLWCAKMTPVVGPPGTGQYKNAKCTEKEEDGEYTEVIVPEEQRKEKAATGLPEISITLAGSSYPLDLNYESSTVVTKLEDGAGALLEGKGLKLLLLTAAESSLGTFNADFLNNIEASSNRKCHTSGDKTATVLSEGSFHIVYTSLSPLELGILFLPHEVKVECEGVTTKVRGDVISSINEASDSGSLTSIKGKLEKGSTAGSQEITEYYNTTGTKVKAELIAETGSVEHKSNEQVKEETTLTASGSNMFEIVNK